MYQTGGGNADSPTGGVKINLVPKEGGNRFSGSFFTGLREQLSAERQPHRFLAVARRQVGRQDRHVQRHRPRPWAARSRRTRCGTSGRSRFFTVNKPIANTYVPTGAGGQDVPAALADGRHAVPQGVDPQHHTAGWSA